MKKIVFIIYFIFTWSTIYPQTGDDGWNNRELSGYGENEEKARVSIKLLPGFSTAGHAYFKAYIDPDIPYNNGVAVTDGEINMNYIRTFAPIRDNATSSVPSHENLDYDLWNETIQYFDGLGRLRQTVAVKGSAVSTDLVQPVVYDEFGRQKFEYLPYTIAQEGTNGPGGYRPDPIAEQEDFYSFYHPDDEAYAFAEKEFDDSPLNRVMEQYLPGSAWREGNGYKVTYDYETNIANEIPVLGVQSDHDLEKTGFYAAATLFRNTTTDENGSQTTEYKDKQGRVVAKVVDAVDLTDPLMTYYVYDKFSNLRYVVPPEAAPWVKSHADGTIGHSTATPTLQQLCYYYQYDARRRMTIKKLPGAESVYMVYNERDQLVLMQDGNMRSPNNTGKNWLFTKYDVFNRPVMTGMYQHSTVIDQGTMQIVVNNEQDYFETYDGTGDYGYSNDAFPDVGTAGCEIYTVTWYDDGEYAFLNLDCISGGNKTNDYSFRGDNQFFMEEYLENNGEESTHTKGMVIGTMTSILPNSEITLPPGTGPLFSVNYYDIYGRVVQTITDNHLGGQDVVSHRINFTADILLTKEQHSDGSQGVTVIHGYEYDNNKRLLSTSHQIAGEDAVVLSRQTYDELDRLKRKELHSTNNAQLQTINYTYNIRGWLTNINDVSALGNDMFAMQLGYTTGSHPQYNGNIAVMQWYTQQFGSNTYNFDYDGANRLALADFTGTGLHSTTYSYDKNGNIETLTREGRYGGSSIYGSIDDLTYTYQGNQLQSVNDINDGYGPHQASGFTDDNSFGTTEYTYDDNGNMLSDLNKDLTVAYNFLNLPQQIDIDPTSENREINYLYNATGQKLRKATREDNAPVSTTDYCGSFVYEGGVLQYILTVEGRVVVDGSNYEYQYSLKDHLGNTRVTFGEDGIIQEDSYYPFGMTMAGLSHQSGEDLPNKYLYNGKELQDDYGLDWYDYGARFYDPVIGRWHVMDPLTSERVSLSPYNFCSLNPINRIDPNGALDTWYTDKEGNVLMQTNDGSNDVVTVSDDKVADFEYYAESYENKGMKDVYESKGWNDHWKSEFGLADKQLSDRQIAHLGMLNSDWSRENAVEFWLNPTAGNVFSASFSEALSQWTNPELVVAGLSAGVAGYSATLRSMAGSVDDAANSAKTWLGKDYRTITNKAGDNIFMSKDGLRKMRFDIKSSHGDKPHIHLEQKVNGKWKDATDVHRIYPKN